MKSHTLQPARGGAADGAGAARLTRDADARVPREGRPRATCWSPRRQFAILGADDLGADPFRQPADLDAAGVRPGIHRLQLHGAAARGRAPHDLRAPASGRRARARLALRGAERHLGEPVHALASRSSRRARLRRGRSQARTTCRRRSTRAGSSCSTARRRCSRSTSARRGANRRPIRRRCSGAIALRAQACRWLVPPLGAGG